MQNRFPKKIRIKKRGQISAIFNAGTRVRDFRMMLLGQLGESADSPTRCGVAISKKHGNAVHRNRLKRLCREAFRLTKHELPAGLDLIIMPRIGQEQTLEGLQKSLRKLVQKLEKQLNRT